MVAERAVPPTWIEVTAKIAAADQETALTALLAAGFEQSWLRQPLEHARGADGWETRAADWLELHVALDPADAPAQVALLRAALAELAGDITVGELRAEDWLRSWCEGRDVVQLRDGWSICPPWLAEQAPDPSRAVIIDPGLAFGAGDHPTTRDSAIVLLELVRPGDRVLDIGAGSGVLSILARRAGAREAVALEMDPLGASEIARNAMLNDTDGIEVRVGDATAGLPAGPFDLVLCNIGARLARELCGAIGQVAAPRARLVLSGLTEWAEPAVAEQYAAARWRPTQRRQQDSEWVTTGWLFDTV